MAGVARTRTAALRCAAAAGLIGVLTGCGPAVAPDRTDVGASATPADPIAESAGPAAPCSEQVFWGGPGEGSVPASAGFAPGFALPGTLDGFDVLCAASWMFSQNDCEMQFARAYIDGGAQGARLDEIDEALVGWATDHGLTQTSIGKADNTRSYGIDVNPEDGAVMTLLQWHAVSRFDGQEGVQRHADLAGIPLDGGDVSVSWQVCPALQRWETPPAG